MICGFIWLIHSYVVCFTDSMTSLSLLMACLKLVSKVLLKQNLVTQLSLKYVLDKRTFY